MQAEHQLNLEDLARQIRKMATRIDRRFLATSDPLVSRRQKCMERILKKESASKTCCTADN